MVSRPGMTMAMGLAWLLLAEGASTQLRGLERPSPGAVLERAFDNLYECDIRTLLELTLHDRSGGTAIRRAEIARKRIDGRLHSYGRFLEPPWMRDTAILIIDSRDSSDAHYLSLPELQRIRRVTSVQRQDAFLGSDLWYEDLERRYPHEYEELSMSVGERSGEDVWIVDARPKKGLSGYDRVRFVVARSDALLLETVGFRQGSSEPFKALVADREHVLRQDGHVLPTRLTVSNLLRKTHTEVYFRKLQINPTLSDQLFTSLALEAGRKVPGLSGQRKGEQGAHR